MLEIVLLVMGILAEFLAKTNNNIKLGLPSSYIKQVPITSVVRYTYIWHGSLQYPSLGGELAVRC